MLYFLCKTILHRRNGYSITAQNPSIPLSSFLRYLSSDANQLSFTVSYLINTCGLSPESALSTSKYCRLKTPEKSDLVLSIFKNLGFKKHQISYIIVRWPLMLLSKPERTIIPKFEFFRSKGASNSDLVRIFGCCPWVFKRSLEKHLVPSFNFFRDLLKSDEKTLAAIKRCPSILLRRLEDQVIPAIDILRENGVPEANILHLIHYHPLKLQKNPDKFKKTVDEVREMGFRPSKLHFVIAVMVLAGLRKSKWESKVDAYKRWGWSNEDVITAFGKYPLCMTISEDKIMAVMDFYVNKLGLDSSVIANRPVLLSLSLKKRLVPRGSLIQFMSSKGLVKIDSHITVLCERPEKFFMEKFVDRYKEAPQLLKLYNELKQQGEQQQEIKR
ncbi:uncharacterized protein LOC110656838 [Hevea brasiliensis]|uniref:uncharacterized protein LOC110656838 n=1 Tax=Hevea brasiliensis TaxID=3981 RepID=UPI0025E4993B|nr:uncharacterized protein LOC110656838 [Hevea brasiliensis]